MSSDFLNFIKWVRFFEQNCIVKWMNFSLVFFDFEKIKKLKKNSDNVHWKVWTNMKKLYARYWKNIFKERIPNMRFWIIYILVQISFFRGWHFYSAPQHKRASYDPVYRQFIHSFIYLFIYLFIHLFIYLFIYLKFMLIKRLR